MALASSSSESRMIFRPAIAVEWTFAAEVRCEVGVSFVNAKRVDRFWAASLLGTLCFGGVLDGLAHPAPKRFSSLETHLWR